MNKVLVTGGCGFIGSHLVERLLDDGNKVVVIDNMSVGSKKNLPVHKNLTVVVADILDNIGYLFKDIDTVYHLAAMTRPQISILEPLESDTINVHGTLKVLKHCHDNKVERVLFVSSSSLYGTPETLPTPENETVRALAPYGVQKYIGEEYCWLFARMYDMKINCVRPFNVYGYRQSPLGGYAAAVPKFIEALSNNKPGNITGDGEQTRDFVYVDDVVDLIIRASITPYTGESFNVGSGKNVSINYLYEAIGKIMGKDITPVYIDPVFEPPTTLADISKSMALLDWKPKFTLEDGLAITIKETLK